MFVLNRPEMTMEEAIKGIGRGNPGALSLLVSMVPIVPAWDPDARWGMWEYLEILDLNRVYGSEISKLFQVDCRMDLRRMFIFLRALEAGLEVRVTDEIFVKWPFEDLLDVIRTERPNFLKA